ncbi:P3 protein isoform X2 [Leptinotarsa decemlineata]|uniref:P3 protein isoform X2 n=1 Tax=Leptinotarsa decemlineata TaxID=7539 RepID=UPI003D30D3FF
MNPVVFVTIFALFYSSRHTDALQITFIPSVVTVNMGDSVSVSYEIRNYSHQAQEKCILYSENINIASLENETLVLKQNGTFEINGIFLGKTFLLCKSQQRNNTTETIVEVIVIRKERIIDVIFTASVASLVSLIYINFGCAMNWGDLKHILKKPTGPIIGFCGQYIFMPLLSYGLGKLLFPTSPAMQLGMFFTGTSPGGGASNLWTLLLDGNINLSIAMSAVSTIAAFAMMPFWIFTLGRLIFESGNLAVPYTQVFSYVIALLVPLGIGYLIQRYLRKVANYLIIVAGMAVPWMGFLAGFLMSKFLRQPPPDCTAIAIEIGIQNTGIAIFLLRFSLPQPEADLTTVVPVSIGILTPFPLLFLLIYKKIYARFSRSTNSSTNDPGSVATLKI